LQTLPTEISVLDLDKLDFSGKKILVIDDSAPNLELLRFALGKKKFEVFTFSSSQEGLKGIETIAPDVVLLDIDLPDQNGIDICKTLKSNPLYMALPVIFTTGHSDSQTMLKAFEAGAADYIVKPLRLPEVIARLRTHLKITHLIKSQEEHNAALKNANTEINKLLGVATHDLRNPLVSIRGLTEFLQDGSVGETNAQQKELLTTIHDAAETLLFLVENLLDYSSVEAGVLKLECKETQLLDIVNKAMRLHSISASKKEIELKVINEACTLPLFLDQNRISQVVDNLISNAIKFSPFKTQIHIILKQDTTHTYLKVQDQGPGIPETEMNKLFKSFGRTSVRPTANEKSTGLGLVICRKIVESHQGTILVQNLSQGGAEFCVTLNNAFKP
jgi:two-component system, sensor histidine kinase and response regulator